MFDPANPRLVLGLCLFAMVKDPTGAPKGVLTNYNLTACLDYAELCKLAERVGERAEAVERGEPASDHQIQLN